MGALVAVRHDPEMGAFYHRLLSRGKRNEQALVAVAHKLRFVAGKLRGALGWLPLRSSGHLAYGANPRYFFSLSLQRGCGLGSCPYKDQNPSRKGQDKARQRTTRRSPALTLSPKHVAPVSPYAKLGLLGLWRSKRSQSMRRQ